MSFLATVAVPVLQPVTANGYVGYFASLSAGSRPAMKASLGRVLRDFFGYDGGAAEFPWHELRFVHTTALRSWMAETYAPNTANRIRSAVRGILRQCHRLGQIAEVDYRHAIDFPPVRGSRPAPGRSIPMGEVRELFKASRELTLELAARNAAMVAVLYGGMLRRAELCTLDLESLSDDMRELRVKGKGNKVRVVYLPRGAGEALEAWLALRGREPGPLFHPTAGRPRKLQRHRRISDDTVADVCARLADLAGVGEITPHDFRRTGIGELLDHGADLATVARMVGHASVTTTQRYDRRGERAQRAAAELLCVPFEAAPAEAPPPTPSRSE